MDRSILKTTVTVEFAGDEVMTAASALQLIAACRGIATTEPVQPREATPNDPAEDQTPEKPKSETAARPARVRPSRAKQPDPGAMPEPKANQPEEPVDKQSNVSNITHDDIRNLMAEVIATDDNNRTKVLKQFGVMGVKNVGAIQVDDLESFYRFLQDLKID